MFIVIAYIESRTNKSQRVQPRSSTSTIQEFAQCRTFRIHKFFSDDDGPRNEEDGSERPEVSEKRPNLAEEGMAESIFLDEEPLTSHREDLRTGS